MLQLDAVTKRFGVMAAVDTVSLGIPAGQMVGVIGRSGAGKSTLLRLVNRLIEPSAGRIAFDGADVTALKGRRLRTWRARCAMVFQQFNLVNRLDVLTNALIGRVSETGDLPVLFKHFSAADRAMAAHALDRLDLLPQALQRVDTLSGGQQQRVAIARALLQKPAIILADEPIASLDPHNAERVMDALRTINREDGITVVCNLHALDMARTYCDRIVGMVRGRVIFDGGPSALGKDEIHAIYADEADENLIAVSSRPRSVYAPPVRAA